MKKQIFGSYLKWNEINKMFKCLIKIMMVYLWFIADVRCPDELEHRIAYSTRTYITYVEFIERIFVQMPA